MEMNNMDNRADECERIMEAMVNKFERLFENSPQFDAMTSGKLQAYRDSLEIFKEAFGR